MEWNYYNTFITISADCPAENGLIPPDKKGSRTKPGIEYELAADHPYEYTQEELLYQVHVRHKGLSEEELQSRGTQVRDEFFMKPTACLRASMLPKKYGWGIHFNAEGKLALVAVDSPDYQDFVQGKRSGVKVVAAMRNSKK